MGLLDFLFKDPPPGKFDNQHPDDKKAALAAAEAKRSRKQAKAVAEAKKRAQPMQLVRIGVDFASKAEVVAINGVIRKDKE